MAAVFLMIAVSSEVYGRTFSCQGWGNGGRIGAEPGGRLGQFCSRLRAEKPPEGCRMKGIDAAHDRAREASLGLAAGDA
jgi:hypothetical protein